MNGIPSGPPLLEALNVGAIDFGIAGRSAADLRAGGQRRWFYLAYDPPPGEAILVPKDSTLKPVADLKARRLLLNKGSAFTICW